MAQSDKMQIGMKNRMAFFSVREGRFGRSLHGGYCCHGTTTKAINGKLEVANPTDSVATVASHAENGFRKGGVGNARNPDHRRPEAASTQSPSRAGGRGLFGRFSVERGRGFLSRHHEAL